MCRLPPTPTSQKKMIWILVSTQFREKEDIFFSESQNLSLSCLFGELHIFIFFLHENPIFFFFCSTEKGGCKSAQRKTCVKIFSSAWNAAVAEMTVAIWLHVSEPSGRVLLHSWEALATNFHFGDVAPFCPQKPRLHCGRASNCLASVPALVLRWVSEQMWSCSLACSDRRVLLVFFLWLFSFGAGGLRQRFLWWNILCRPKLRQ